MQPKGKAEPLALFRPLAPRARFGSDVTRTHATPLVGRELEKPLLIGTFERSAQQRSCQLVTIVGEPGVGKSRLCAELFAYLEDRPGSHPLAPGPLPSLRGGDRLLGARGDRQGGVRDPGVRLAGGGGGEARAGASRERIPTCAWLKARLAPLVGAGGEPASQEESFTAWRRVLEAWAEARETILVFEDLHWARRGAALLPRAPGRLGGGGAAARPLHRPPGAVRAAPQLRRERSQLAADQPRPTHGRGDGPPHRLAARAGGAAGGDAAGAARARGRQPALRGGVRAPARRPRRARREVEEVPDSVQALIAARLDTLSPDRKSLLQDAAVIGKVFWAGALAEMGGRELARGRAGVARARPQGARAPRPHQLDGGRAGVQLLAPAGQGRLLRADPPRRTRRPPPRGSRLDRAQGGRASGRPGRRARPPLPASPRARARRRADGATQELEANAIRYLALAGERALGLDAARAEARLAQALDLCPRRGSRAAELLGAGRRPPCSRAGSRDAATALEEALAAFRARGIRRARPRADALSRSCSPAGRPAPAMRSQPRPSSCSRRSSPARRSSRPTLSLRRASSLPAHTPRRSRLPSGR